VITAKSSQTGTRMKIATAPWPQFDQSHPHQNMAGKRRTSTETAAQQTSQAPRGLLANHGASGKRNGAKRRRYMRPPNTSSGVIGVLSNVTRKWAAAAGTTHAAPCCVSRIPRPGSRSCHQRSPRAWAALCGPLTWGARRYQSQLLVPTPSCFGRGRCPPAAAKPGILGRGEPEPAYRQIRDKNVRRD